MAGLEHGLKAEGGSGGIAAGVGDELLALGKITHDLGDAVNGLVGHLGVGVLLAVPLLPDVNVAEADIGADIDDGAVLGKDDLCPLGHVAGGDLDHHDVALLRGLADILLREVHDDLIIEAAQSGVMRGDGIAGAVSIEHVDKLALGMVDHHAEHFAANITGSTDAGIMNHVCFLLVKSCNDLMFCTAWKIPRVGIEFSLLILYNPEADLKSEYIFICAFQNGIYK